MQQIVFCIKLSKNGCLHLCLPSGCITKFGSKNSFTWWASFYPPPFPTCAILYSSVIPRFHARCLVSKWWNPQSREFGNLNKKIPEIPSNAVSFFVHPDLSICYHLIMRTNQRRCQFTSTLPKDQTEDISVYLSTGLGPIIRDVTSPQQWPRTNQRIISVHLNTGQGPIRGYISSPQHWPRTNHRRCKFTSTLAKDQSEEI